MIRIVSDVSRLDNQLKDIEKEKESTEVEKDNYKKEYEYLEKEKLLLNDLTSAQSKEKVYLEQELNSSKENFFQVSQYFSNSNL
jgi:hypothetical protein